MPIASPTETVTDDQLQRFATLIYDRTGIRISPQKKTLLTNRLRRRLRATGIICFDEYFRLLNTIPKHDDEWHAFLQEITTHETYLFRDAAQWTWFTKTYLPEIQSAAQRGERHRTLRIWSAACSTGDEAYTIASCIADRLSNHVDWNISIVGTDIGAGAVEEARAATFGQRAMKLVPDNYARRYFTRIDDDCWQAKSMLTQWTRFERHNLLDRLKLPEFDLVFVKNVFIYFDPDSKRRAFENIDKSLRSGGMLVTGPAEGMSNLLHQYERCLPWLHKKA